MFKFLTIQPLYACSYAVVSMQNTIACERDPSAGPRCCQATCPSYTVISTCIVICNTETWQFHSLSSHRGLNGLSFTELFTVLQIASII